MRYCAHINNEARWDESKHKRDKSGRFSKTGGGGASASQEPVAIQSNADPNAKGRKDIRFSINPKVQDQIDKVKDSFTDREKHSFEQNYEKMSRTQNPERAKEKAQLLVNLLKRKGLNVTVDELMHDSQGKAKPVEPKPEPKPKPKPKPAEPKPEPKPVEPKPEPKPASRPNESIGISKEQHQTVSEFDQLAKELGGRNTAELIKLVENHVAGVKTKYTDINDYLYNYMPYVEFTEQQKATIAKYAALRKELNGTPSEYNNQKHVESYVSRFSSYGELNDMREAAKSAVEFYQRSAYNKSDFDGLTSASSQFSDIYDRNPRLVPQKFAGVKRGKPMSFAVADRSNSNPGVDTGKNGFLVNCQTCVPCMELRCRGYDVVASQNTDRDGCLNTKLSASSQSVYLNPETGEPKFKWKDKDGLDSDEVYFYEVKRGEQGRAQNGRELAAKCAEDFEHYPTGRYSLAFTCKNFGHTVMIVKDERGARVIDPQYNTKTAYEQPLGEYLNEYARGLTQVYGVRTDNAIINPLYESLFLPRNV